MGLEKEILLKEVTKMNEILIERDKVLTFGT